MSGWDREPLREPISHWEKPLNIGIDFDNTITAEPTLFREYIKMATRRGHNVYIVTARLKTVHPEDLDPWRGIVDGVFFTEHKAKRPFMQAQGINIDVMIDDCPEAWVEDYNGAPRTFDTERDAQEKLAGE